MARNKGERIVDSLSNYIVFDLETTDKSVNFAEIIEIAALKVEDGIPVDSFSTLVKPEFPIPKTATAINGITNEMVINAPRIEQALNAFLEFVGDGTLLGHNITTYDTNIIYDYNLRLNNKEFKNNYLDTLYMARQCLPDLSNYRLGTIAESFGLETEGAHRALFDCNLTHQVYQLMLDVCRKNGIRLIQPGASNSRGVSNQSNRGCYSEETIALRKLHNHMECITTDNELTEDEVIGLKTWMDDNSFLAGNYPFDVVMSSLERVLEDGVVTQDEKDHLLMLYKKFTAPVECAEHETIFSLEGIHCCLTGDFVYGSRKEVEEYIENHGGLCDKTVKKATTYVVVGSNGSEAWKQGIYGSKIKKALELQEKGVCISIITEKDFFNEIERCNDGR